MPCISNADSKLKIRIKYKGIVWRGIDGDHLLISGKGYPERRIGSYHRQPALPES